MSIYYISLHVIPPTAIESEVKISWRKAQSQVANRAFGSTVLGLHDKQKSDFMFFAATAHIRDKNGKFIMPENPDDQLFDMLGKPLPDAIHKTVSGTLVDATERQAVSHVIYTVHDDIYGSVKNYVDEKKISPEKYNTYHNNCVTFAMNALNAGDLIFSTNNVSRSVARLRRPEDVDTTIRSLNNNTDMQPIIKLTTLNRSSFIRSMPAYNYSACL